jgi:hypothetical protein
LKKAAYLLIARWLDLPRIGGEMPAVGNKGKVFCSFVEYHWESDGIQERVDFKRATLNPC